MGTQGDEMTTGPGETLQADKQPATLTHGLPEKLVVGDRVSYHSMSAGRQLNAEVMAILPGGRYRVQSEQFFRADKPVKSEKVLQRCELHPAKAKTADETAADDRCAANSSGGDGSGDAVVRHTTVARKRSAENEAAADDHPPIKVARRGMYDKENFVTSKLGQASDTDGIMGLSSAPQLENLAVGLLISVFSGSKKAWVLGRVERIDTSTSDEARHFADIGYIDDPGYHKVLVRHQVPQNIRLQASSGTSVLTEVECEALPAEEQQDEQRPTPQPRTADNPYWLGLGPEGIRRAIVPPAGFQLDRLTIINDFGPTNAEDIRQVLAAYLPGEMADNVQVLCLHGGCNPRAGETWPRQYAGRSAPVYWNAPGGNFRCFQVSNWLYRRDGHRVTFDSSTAEKHNNTWGHVHPKLLLAVFKPDDRPNARNMNYQQDVPANSQGEQLRLSVFTNGPFGGGVCNGRCEYAAWYSMPFPVAKFGHVTPSDFRDYLHDFIARLVEAADKEYSDNPLYFPPGQVQCQCGLGKSGACKTEEDDGRPSCSGPVMELLRVVTHADCSAADTAGYRVVSSVIGQTDPNDRCQYGHVRINTLASRFWGSDGSKMEKTPPSETRHALAASIAPTYAELMTEDEKRSDLSLVIIVHNIAAGCTPRFLSNFGACWKIANQQNVRVAWPAAACLAGDPDNAKLENLFAPFLKGFTHTYLSDTYSSSSRDTIKGRRHAVWQGDDHDGNNYLFKYQPHLLSPRPRQFGRWSGWRDDDPTVGLGLPLENVQDGTPANARSDAQLLNAAPLLSDTIDEKRRMLEFEKALSQAEVTSSKMQPNKLNTARADWFRSGGKVTGGRQNAAPINAFSPSDLTKWSDEAAVGETLCIRGLDRPGRCRVREIIRRNHNLSTALTTESIGYGNDRWLRITRQPMEERRYAHHFQQYVVLDAEQNPIAFLLTSANLSSFAWGEQCQCGEELPSFGLLPDRDHRGKDDCYNATTGSHDFWMRNFEFGIMDLQPTRRDGLAECSAQTECTRLMEKARRPHALPIAVDICNMERFEPWEEPWCTRAHERLCERVDERHMAILQQQLLDFAKPNNLGKIFPMDTGLTLAERSQVRDICREICDPFFNRNIPPWLHKDRIP